MNKVMEWAVAAALGILLAVGLRLFAVEGFEISGDSMLPTFQDGDFVLAEKVSYKLGELGHGDVVIVETEALAERKIIKRVIGLEGDVLSISEGVLFRNGEQVEEPYIQEGGQEDLAEVVVGEGQVYVLGDNRNNSMDSRYLGVFTYADIKGRVAVELLNDPFRFY